MFRWFKRRQPSEREIEEEINYHLDMLTRERLEEAYSRDEASFSARRKLGNRALIKESLREISGWASLERIRQDLRYAVRMMLRNPGFTLTAVLMLAIGIGANTAIFSLIDAFLLRLLPVEHPEQLVLVQRTLPRGGTADDFSYPAFEQLRDRNRSLSRVFAIDSSTFIANVDGQPDVVSGDFASGSYFQVLGVKAILGRTFTTEDDRPAGIPVAVISYGYWNRRFGGDTSVIGKTITFGSTPFTVIGVTSRHFFGLRVAGRSGDVVLPMFVHSWLALKDHDTFEIMGRLKPGTSPEQARADLDLFYHRGLVEAAGSRLSPQKESKIRAQRIEIKPGLRGMSEDDGRFATELKILLGAVGIALLIACVNIANSLLARASARQREIVVHLAIGASRTRLIRQLTESVFLALIGGGLGLLFAKWGVGVILAVLSQGQRPIPFYLSPDLRILLFTAAVSPLTGVAFGVIPALTATRLNMNPIMKGNEGGVNAAPLRRRVLSLPSVNACKPSPRIYP